MAMFMLVVSGIPSKENKDAFSLAGAIIHVWIESENASIAKEKAYNYIKRYHWIPESVEHAFEILPGQLPQLGASESRLYHQAQQFGIAADFLAWPKDQSRPRDPVHFRWLDQE